jgi:hypothetical protein
MKSDTFRNDIQKLVFNATAIANIADNAATSPLTNLYLALHTAWPGAAGVQNTSEAAYGSYARQAVARTSGGFTVTNDDVTLAANVSFPQASSGTETLMFFSVGVASSGATKILHVGVIGTNQGPFTGLNAGDVLTVPAHTFANDDRAVVIAYEGSTLPAGLTEGTVYYVVGVSGNTLQLSATQGGAAVAITADGDGTIFKVDPIAVTSGVTPQLTTGTTITEG